MLRRLPHLSLLVLLMASSSLSFADAGNVSNLSAEQIVNRVVATYEAMTSYRDRGASVQTFGSGVEAFQARREFQTLFTRPDKLRFAWDDEWSQRPGKLHYVIWSDGTSAWSSYPFNNNRPEQERSLSLAVAGATGISATSAHTIPRLLMADMAGIRIDQLEDYSVTGEESIDGVACVQINAHYRTGGSFAMWVGRDDNLIRKIIDGPTVETRTDIVVNGKIDDSSFKE